jgi:hypothetical protein
LIAFASTFCVPKRGSSSQENEDAWWVGPDGHGNDELHLKSLRVAIADGASSSMLSGRWARRLVAVYGNTKGAARAKNEFVMAYREAARCWDQEVLEYVEDRELRGVPIQWYEEPGLAKGAHATLLVVEFSDGRPGYPPRWKAAGIGDSCLFQVRGEFLHSCFPIGNFAEFSYQTPLLPSKTTEDDVLRRNICLTGQTWEPEDTFYIATDALAAWFLRNWEAGQKPWIPLRDFNVDADFAAWVEQQRDLNEIHNDDTTLIRIDMWSADADSR